MLGTTANGILKVITMNLSLRTKKVALATASCLMAFSTCVSADDTDIYFSDAALEALGVRPNVLFLLDTSGSMSSTDGTGTSRIDRMKAAMKQILNDDDLQGKINVGIARFNIDAGAIVYGAHPLDANKTALIEAIDAMTEGSSGSTPAVDAYYEVARYFKGMDVHYGLARAGSGGQPDLGSGDGIHRISHPNSHTGEDAPSDRHTPQGCDTSTEANLNDSDCSSEYWKGNPVYESPITDQCQPSHIVMLTDGFAGSNDAEDLVEDLIGLAVGDQCDRAGTDEACGVDLARYLASQDQADDYDGNQVVLTHTVGLEVNDPWLEDIAEAGGGDYYTASTASELAEDFQSILNEVVDINSVFSAPSATVNQFNRLNHLDDIYFAIFHPERTVAWPGNIKKYKLVTGALHDNGTPDDDSDDPVVPPNTIVDANDQRAVNSTSGFFEDDSRDFWSTSTPSEFTVEQGGAANQIADTGTRNIYTWLNTALTAAGDPAPSTALTQTVNEVSSSNGNITKALLGDAAMSDPDYDELRDWMAGIDVEDWDDDNDTTDNRKQMGDPLHSRPVVVTYGLETDASGNEVPELAMFFGTNEGYFHAIDANSGEEHFSFLPEEELGKMNARKNNNSGDHIYGVDGAPTVWVNDIDADGVIEDNGADPDDHVYVYFGFRRGGTSYYALDVTDLDSPEVLWRIEKTGDFAELGQTWSKPIKTKILYDTDPVANDFDANNGDTHYDPAEKDVLIFAGGYDTNQDDISTNVHRRTDSQGRAVFVVDAVTGELLWKADVNSHADMQYSIPATMAVIDPDRSGHADQAYVGDMGGQVWRFDIHNGAYWDGSSQLPSDFISANVVAELAADNSDTEARRFYQSPDVAIIEEDNTPKIALTIGSGYRARPNDTTVQDRFYMIKLPNPFDALGSFNGGSPVNDRSGSTDFIDVTDDLTPDLSASTTFGWYINMENNGEKVLSTPLTVDGNVIFTTYEPTVRLDGCTVQPGTSREYVVNVTNGSPAINRSGGEYVKADRARELKAGTIVDEPVLIFTEHGGGSTFLGTEKGSYDITSNRATRTFWYEKE